jgi:glycosyltransferase involved in cell wall biosynthesis
MGIEALRALLDESFGYVHATGAFIPEPDQPERCEHFGLSVLEAMARGCIPLVYARGGILEVLAPGRSGLVYRSARELVEGFRAMALLRGTAEGRRLQRRARRAAARISHRRFHRAFGGLLLREALWPSPR